jgi:hypothetical protein
MTIYTLGQEPRYVRDRGQSPLSGFYRAEFTTSRGDRLVRYLTDKGRAEVLRRMEAGQREFSEEELQRWTVEPDLELLEARTVAEAGEGA